MTRDKQLLYLKNSIFHYKQDSEYKSLNQLSLLDTWIQELQLLWQLIKTDESPANQWEIQQFNKMRKKANCSKIRLTKSYNFWAIIDKKSFYGKSEINNNIMNIHNRTVAFWEIIILQKFQTNVETNHVFEIYKIIEPFTTIHGYCKKNCQ